MLQTINVAVGQEDKLQIYEDVTTCFLPPCTVQI